MYAYVDETGNTGNSIFDSNQPLFITAAMMTRSNFDVIWKRQVARIAKKVGVQALHANELGIGKIDDIALDLLKLVKDAKCNGSQSKPCRLAFDVAAGSNCLQLTERAGSQ